MVTVQKRFLNYEFSAMPAEELILHSVNPGALPVEPELFRAMVAARAFYKAEQRGFEPGHELEDWLEAEQDLLNDPSLLSGALK